MAFRPVGLEDLLAMDELQRGMYNVVARICRGLRTDEEAAFKEKRYNDKLVPALRKHSQKGRSLFGFSIAEEYGGLGLDLLTSLLLMQRIAEEGFSLSTFFSGHISIGQKTLEGWGTEEQKQKYLPKTTMGECIMAFALTEPNAGSDPLSLQTHFEKTEKGYLLNGSKIWISNGTIADVITVYAKDKQTGKISAFIVEKGFGGFTAEREHEKEFLVTSDSSKLYFTNCEVPEENLLGEEGKGHHIIFSTLDYGRLGKAACSLGVMLDCLKESLAFVQERHQFGKPIGKHQLVQEHLAEMKINLDAAAGLVYAAALEKMKADASPEDVQQRTIASMLIAEAKKFATEKANEAAGRAVQLQGSSGIRGRVAMHYMDSKVPLIYEGTSEILKLKIAADMLGSEFTAFR